MNLFSQKMYAGGTKIQVKKSVAQKNRKNQSFKENETFYEKYGLTET